MKFHPSRKGTGFLGARAGAAVAAAELLLQIPRQQEAAKKKSLFGIYIFPVGSSSFCFIMISTWSLTQECHM